MEFGKGSNYFYFHIWKDCLYADQASSIGSHHDTVLSHFLESKVFLFLCCLRFLNGVKSQFSSLCKQFAYLIVTRLSGQWEWGFPLVICGILEMHIFYDQFTNIEMTLVVLFSDVRAQGTQLQFLLSWLKNISVWHISLLWTLHSFWLSRIS